MRFVIASCRAERGNVAICWIATVRFAFLAVTIVFERALPAYAPGNKSSALGSGRAFPFTPLEAADSLQVYEKA